MRASKHFQWLLRWLLLIFIPVFGLHGALLTAMDKSDFWAPLVWCYGAHTVLTAAIGGGILWGHKKAPDLIGFMFLGGSLFKFAAYFALFKPVILAGLSDRELSFFLFGIPYAVALALETIFVSRILGINKS